MCRNQLRWAALGHHGPTALRLGVLCRNQLRWAALGHHGPTALRLWIVLQHECWSVLFTRHSKINWLGCPSPALSSAAALGSTGTLYRAGTVGLVLQCSLFLLPPIGPLSGIAGAEKGMQCWSVLAILFFLR